MTVEELEQRIAACERITELFVRGRSVDDRVDYLMLQARLGIFTEYWGKQPFGFGAALSVGTAGDRFGGYFEIDQVTCPDFPSVALFAQNVAVNPYGQSNHAIEGYADNAAVSRALHVVAQQHGFSLRVEGVEVVGDWHSTGGLRIGTSAADARVLWP